MLSKKNRVNKKLIDKIFKEGRFVNSPNLTLKFIKEESLYPKIAFISPKTASKKAVDRNLLRRRG
ncbi:MAG: ribonuclease P protein component, partial [bacterium]